MTIIEEFVLHLKVTDIPESVVHQAKRCLMDLIGVLAAGTKTPLCTIIADHAYGHFGGAAASARILGDGRLSSPQGVALAGGMTIDAIDAHDGMKLTKGHAGCGVLPALIAVLEASEKDYDDDDFLSGLIIGYEIAIRAGISLHHSVPDYHTSGAWVALATAAISCRVLEATPAQLYEALGIAEYHGPRSQMMRNIDFPTMLKDGSGWGSMAGVAAAYLAVSGFTGAPALTITKPDVQSFWRDLGTKWHIIDQYIKPWPICRWAQPSVTACESLIFNHDIDPMLIEHISITSFHEAIRLSTRIPINTEQAQYSLPWPVAALASRKILTTEEITEPFNDPQIRRLACSMRLKEDDKYNAKFPQERLAHVEITMKNGEKLLSEPTAATWDPENPPSDKEIIKKFHGLADSVFGRCNALELNQHIWSLGSGGLAKIIINMLSQKF